MARGEISNNEKSDVYQLESQIKQLIDNDETDVSALNRLYADIEPLMESYVQPIKRCLAILIDYCETMSITNGYLLDNDANKASVMNLFIDLEQSLQLIQDAMQSQSLGVSEKHALKYAYAYAQQVIKAHKDLLEKYHQTSVALRWFLSTGNPLNKG